MAEEGPDPREPEPPAAGGEPFVRPPAAGGEPFVGPRDWPPAEMRWPPHEAPAAAGAKPRSRAPLPWSPFVLLFAYLPIAAVLHYLLLAAVYVVQTGAELEEAAEQTERVVAHALTTSTGILLLVLPIQLAHLVAALGGAALSRTPIRERLGLVRGRVSRVGLALILLATPLVELVGLGLAALFFDLESDVPQYLTDMLTDMPVIPSLLLFAVIPGICEELVYRGFVQRRLLASWRPFWAIGFTALAFAAAHMDPVRMVAVLPLGLWLSWVSWRTGATWPAMLCHALNNGIAIAWSGWSES